MLIKEQRDKIRQTILNSLGEEETFVFDWYTDHYMASNKGRVMNFLTKKILKPTKNNRGYYYVKLYNNGKKHTVGVHTLVARAFLNNLKEYEVNHIDLDKSNNSLSNLELTTRQENLDHARLNGAFKSLKGEKSPSCKFNNSIITNMLFMKKSGYKLSDIAKKYNTSISYACTLIKKGKQNE